MSKKDIIYCAKLLLISYVTFSLIFSCIDFLKNGSANINPLSKITRSIMKSFLIFYEAPVKLLFGYDSFIVVPFEFICDSLYKLSVSLLPYGDGESEFVWYERFYEDFYYFELDMFGRHGKNSLNNRVRLAYLEKVVKNGNTIGTHLVAFSKVKISDPKIRKKRIILFLKLSNMYVYSSFLNYEDIKAIKGEKHYRLMELADPIELEKLKKVCDLYVDLKRYCLKSEPESIRYANEDPRVLMSEGINFMLHYLNYILTYYYLTDSLTSENKYIYYAAFVTDEYSKFDFNLFDAEIKHRKEAFYYRSRPSRYYYRHIPIYRGWFAAIEYVAYLYKDDPILNIVREQYKKEYSEAKYSFDYDSFLKSFRDNSNYYQWREVNQRLILKKS